jgi:putative methanogenesis marker protein 5
MNVVVVPDAAMIVIPLIEKNGHEYLSPSNVSRYDNMDICEGNLVFDNLITKYSSSELPSGVKSRLFLFSKVLRDADAAIIIGKRPKSYEKMYNTLNDLILFGGNACNNAHSLSVKMIHDLNIPHLKLSFPTTQYEIIQLIDKTNNFLENLNQHDGEVNVDNLSVDLTCKNEKYPVFNVKKILDKLI